MKTVLRQNMGILDRVLRICAGIILLVLATFVATGTTATVLLVLTIPLLIPGITGFCPSYSLFGISTKREGTIQTN